MSIALTSRVPSPSEDRGLRAPEREGGSAEAKLEEALLLEGKIVPVSGDDSIHAASHEQAISSDSFRQATSHGQLALILHLSQHLMRLADGSPVRIDQSSYREEA